MKSAYDKDGIVLYHGDLRDVMPTLSPKSVKLLWTDPPYGHDNLNGDLAASRVGVKGGRQRPAKGISNDGRDDMRVLVDDMLKLALPLLDPVSCCCCCCCCGGGGPSPTFAWLAERMDRDGLSFFHALVWDKSARGDGLGWRFRRNYEMLMVAHKRGGKLAWSNPDLAVPNILRTPPVPNVDHSTTKPEGLIRDLILWTTSPGDLVLDPCVGSGSTLVAARNAGRRAVGIELDADHVASAIKVLASPRDAALEEVRRLPAVGGSDALRKWAKQRLMKCRK